MKIELISQRSGIYGGLKRLYRLATYFIEAGHEAVVNIDDGSTSDWFVHSVPENKDIDPDIRIMPETWQKPHPTAKNILYVQAQFDPPEDRYDGIVTTTDFLADKLREEGFEPDYIVPYGFDSSKFRPPNYETETKKVWGAVAYMPRKNKQEFELVKIFAPEYKYIPIDGADEAEVIEKLQEANVFLALSREEGFGMPPFEAALCGCVIVGYHGKGGKKWLTPDTSVLCEFPQEVADKLSNAINGEFDDQRYALQTLIKEDLTLEKESEAWLNILSDVSSRTSKIPDTTR